MADLDDATTESALKQAQEDLRKQRELLKELLQEKYEPIAIVGVGLRFPGGNDSLEGFTEFLREGRSAIGPFPKDRWDVEAYASGEGRGVIRTSGGGFLDGLERFDPKFFKTAPAEAHCLDPQQRLVLETAWESLEHAGIDPTALRHGNGGIYVGASSLDYVMEMDELRDDELDGRIAAGVSHSGICGRLSYFLGWRGPSLTVDTACSASLVALHLAVQGLRRRECDIALAGGVNAIHHPRSTALFSDLSALSPDGRCKTFDDTADGYGRAEGCGMIVLKRLSDARRDGDTVLALVRGSAVGQDGESAGLTVPNGAAQEALLRRALSSARLEPGDIQYVEAHGTGTPLGDPIEIGAISEVFADSHSRNDPLIVGSSKTNLGHMEPAAGIGGVIKAVAQLRSGEIFPHLNFEKPSTRIPWEVSPVEIPTECRPWKSGTRRAMVNSFGFAGTLASAVLEEAPAGADGPAREEDERAGDANERGGHVFTLSAKSARSLALQIERYQRLLADRPGLPVSAICYTGNTGRAHFDHRIAGVVRDHAGLSALLADRADRADRPATAKPEAIRKAVFLFTGQGAQHPGMGLALYGRHPLFRRTVDELDELFTPHLGRSIRELMFGRTEDAGELHRTRYTQPALFVLEYALARLWLSWGVRPSAVIGHSIGEVVAAAVAGLFTVPDAVRLVAVRARLMDSVTAPGGMAAVGADAETANALVEPYDDLAVAAYNAPTQCVISGGAASLDAATAGLSAKGVRVKRLPVSHAFHSPLMGAVTEEFRAAFDDIAFHEPEFTLISNLTGQVARWRDISKPDYWVRHIAEPVDFAAGMRTVARRGRHAFIEIGPSATLSSLARENLDAPGDTWLTSLRPAQQDDLALLSSAAKLYAAGYPVSWSGFHAERRMRRVVLPGYAFDRQEYWLRSANPRRSAPRTGEDAQPLTAAEGPAVAPTAPAELDTERLLSMDQGERLAALTGHIRALMAAELQFDDPAEIEPGAHFLDLGLDSLAAARLSGQLGTALGRMTTVSEVMDHPSASSLAEFAEQRLTSD
ncbi:beta-ketoacyl synthase N-terminal-like domain-containing protein [Streptomyces sp. NPDC048473]|uniref:beta-ketoacyl synthase N-terminal-like domain-containing protein n=1 Tax=unclassified Streptomyces TaxID=2593676 RepID=UPI003719CEE6